MPHLVFSRFLRARPFASALVLGALLGAPAFAQSDRKPDERRTEDRWRGPPPHQLLDRVDARIAQMKADLRLTEEQNQHWEGFRKALHDIAAARIERMTAPRRPAADAPAPQAQSETQPAPPEPAAGQPDRQSQAAAPPRTDRRGIDQDDDEDDVRMGRADEDRDDRRVREARRAGDRARRDEDRRARDDRREASADALESMQDMAANMRGRADEMQKIAEAARPLYDTLDRRQRRLLTRFVQRDWIMSGMQMSGYGADETGRR